MSFRSIALLLTCASLALGCGGKGGETELPEVDCDKVTVPTFDEVAAFKTNCVICHATKLEGAARQDAPESWNFDDYESASSEPEEVVAWVYDDQMPPPSSGLKVSAADKEQIYAWGMCGAKK
jgi:predicted small lipoprotein YifL